MLHLRVAVPPFCLYLFFPSINYNVAYCLYEVIRRIFTTIELDIANLYRTLLQVK